MDETVEGGNASLRVGSVRWRKERKGVAMKTGESFP